MDDPVIGQIITTLYDFVPRGYAAANGAILNIGTNIVLFATIGTTYGGNGQTTFALPDLRGSSPMGSGTDPVTGLSVTSGQKIGIAGYDPGPHIPSLVIEGTAAGEMLYGADDPDRISGAGGNDRLFGNGGDDTLEGGAGDDDLFGGAGFDTANFSDRKSTRLNSSHSTLSRMPSSA